QLEMDHQLTMLQCRNTPQFRDARRLLYGSVDDGLVAIARSVIDAVRALPADAPAAEPDPEDEVGCHEILEAARHAIDWYRAFCPDFDASVVLRDDTPPG